METRDGIRIFRERCGYRTKSDLARELGLSSQVVSMWESGEREPSFQVAKRLLELGATVEELFGVDCRGSCPHAAQEPEPSGMPEWARRMEARMDQLEQARAKANAG